MKFSIAELGRLLSDYPGIKHYRVAYSGGLDSTVLLTAMARLRDTGANWSLSAVHVHHGLQPEADAWPGHCTRLCSELDTPLEMLAVDASPGQGESPEAAARNARYQALATLMNEDEALLTGHHLDDQAETLLLQLMRGSGLPGLAAMPAESPFSSGLLIRPLLGFSRDELKQYAVDKKLEWVEDSSNEDVRFDRNFIRQRILPELRSRWPSVVQTVSRSAGHMAEAASLLDELAESDLQCILDRQGCFIDINGLRRLSEARQRNLMRHWLRITGLSVPSQKQLHHILHDVLNSRPDATPCVRWSGVEIRRYRDRLYAIPSPLQHHASSQIPWDLSGPLSIRGVGFIRPSLVEGQGLPVSLQGMPGLEIRFRQGGESIQPVRRKHKHDLKKLFQEAGIPCWVRDRTPMLYQYEKVVAVAGLCVCEPFQVGKGEQGLMLEWEQAFN
ncbi:MAG TPA: tRNA lysidine(34) synthetase TilS [Gammaproteobacteria bacterium]|nr:tRNA lysidine(34) synthetase TilS [Gammaproteobacteria bacterium]